MPDISSMPRRECLASDHIQHKEVQCTTVQYSTCHAVLTVTLHYSRVQYSTVRAMWCLQSRTLMSSYPLLSLPLLIFFTYCPHLIHSNSSAPYRYDFPYIEGQRSYRHYESRLCGTLSGKIQYNKIQHTHTNIYIHTHIHTHTNIFTHTHTHTHTKSKHNTTH